MACAEMSSKAAEKYNARMDGKMDQIPEIKYRNFKRNMQLGSTVLATKNLVITDQCEKV